MLLKWCFSIFLLLQFTLSVDVDLVVFNVTVLGSDGRPITGLTADNFHIYEDGREEKIKIFQPEDTPATVGLLIDNSGSMGNKRNDVVNAALAFIGASHPEDEMFIVDFNRKAWLALPPISTTNPDASEFFDLTLQEKSSEVLLERWSYFQHTEPFFRNPENRTIPGLLMVGDAYKQPGYMMVEGVASSVRAIAKRLRY